MSNQLRVDARRRSVTIAGMSSVFQRAVRERWWPGVLASTVVVSLVIAPSYAAGGLAGLAIAALVAGFIGIPLATLEGNTPVPERVRAIGPLVLAVFAAAIAGSELARGGTATVLTATAVALGIAGGWRRRTSWTLGFVGLALLAGGIDLLVDLRAPWTLLEPRWADWKSFAPRSVAIGLALGGAGFGLWRPDARVPGVQRAPWLTGGVALGALLLGAVGAGVAFEASTSRGVWTGLLAGAPALWAVSGDKPKIPWVFGLATLLFWWGGPPLVEWWWSSLFPLGTLVSGFVLAANTRGAARAVGGLAAVLGGASLVVGWNGIPAAAAAAGAVVVVIFVAATSALTREKRA